MPVRLIAADLDDTLLGGDGRVSPRTADILRQAMARGALLVLASGRMPAAMLPFARELCANAPMIAYNGACFADPATGETRGGLSVPEELAREAAALAESAGLHSQAFRGSRFLYERGNRFSRRYEAALGRTGEETGRPLSACWEGPADKLLLVTDPEDAPRAAALFQERFAGRLRCFASRPGYLEITHPRAAKETALAALCEELGVPREETAAFGDGENDLGMVRWAGMGHVMANARPAVLAQAPAVAPPNTEDGVAQVVGRWLRDGTIGGDRR